MSIFGLVGFLREPTVTNRVSKTEGQNNQTVRQPSIDYIYFVDSRDLD